MILEGGRVVLEPRRLKLGRKLGDWLPAMQLQATARRVELDADVDGYSEE